MKIAVIGLAIASIVASPAVFSRQISIESDDWRTASAGLTSVVQIASDEGDCTPLQVHDLDAGIQVVTTSPTCWGNAVATLWVVTSGPHPKVLVQSEGYVVTTHGSKTRWPDLEVMGGTAGTSDEERFHFHNGKYRRTQSIHRTRLPD
jgi:hypothetical protein